MEDVIRHSPGAAMSMLASIGISTLIGVIGAIPALIAGYTFTHQVLAPLGLADSDPTDNDGPMAGIIFGAVVPLLLLVVWLLTTGSFARRSPAPRLVWILSSVALTVPTMVLVQVFVWEVAHV